MYGEPDDLKYLIDKLHEAGIGSSWTGCPRAFSDAHAIKEFDGTHLYEHEDLRRGFILTGTVTSLTMAAMR